MNILVFPPVRESKANPINFMMYSQLEKMGYNIQSYDESDEDFKPDIFHIHWPDKFISGDDKFSGRIKLPLFLYTFIQILFFHSDYHKNKNSAPCH